VKRDKGRAEDKGWKVEMSQMTGSRHDEPLQGLALEACTLLPRLWHELMNVSKA
jgi:hypothetical protein